MSSWNFKDNLTIDNNKFLKFLDSTGVTKNNIIGLDTNSHLHINSSNIGDLYLNSNASSTSANMFINVNNSFGNTFVASRLAIGISNTSNIMSNLTLPINGYIGINTTTNTNSGYLGLVAGSSLLNTVGSRVLLYGIDNTNGNSGQIQLYTGNSTSGHLNVYTGNDSLKMQVLNSGNINFQPDGTTIRLSITDTLTTLTNNVLLSSTTASTGTSNGSLVLSGGLGIKGDLHLDGSLNVNSLTGNINFINSDISTSYTTGATYLVGGLGIQCSSDSSSQTAGGALSVAGGFALGKSAKIGGNIVIYDSTVSTSALTGSGIFNGGVGINGQVNIRSNSTSQIRLIPVTNTNETSIFFGNQNNYTTTGSWVIGQNVNSLGSGFFSINYLDSVNPEYIKFNGTIDTIDLVKYTKVGNAINFYNTTVSNLITIENSSNQINWSIGKIISGNENFHISRYTAGNFINYLLTADTKSGNINILGTENSTSSISGGALTISGGTSIAKNLFIGGNISFNGNLTNTSSTDTNSLSYLTLTGTNSNSLISFGGISVNSTVDTINLTNGGSLTVLGGTSISKSLIVGNTVSSTCLTTSNAYITSITASNINSTNCTSTNIVGSNSSLSNLESTNITVGGIISTNINSTNVTSTNLNASNSTITNIRNTNISTSTLIVSNIINGQFNSNTIGNIFTTGGNTGLGTMTPSFLLDVAGTLRNTGQVYLQNSTTIQTSSNDYSVTSGALNLSGDIVSNSQILYSNFNANPPTFNDRSIGTRIVLYPGITTNLLDYAIGIETGNTWFSVPTIASGYKFYQGSAANFIIAPNGNIGIRNTSPNFSLDVSGTVHITTSLTTGALNSTNITSTNAVFTNSSITNIRGSDMTIGSIVAINVSTGSLSSTNVTSTNVVFTNASTNSLTSTNVQTSSITTNSIIVTSGSLSAVFNSNTIGTLYTTGGNVGINNIAPTYTLDITGTGRFTTSFLALGNANTIGSIITTGGNVGIQNVSPNQPLEISCINYSNNQNGGLRLGTKNYISTSDPSYRYIDIRLLSDPTSNYRGSIFATLSGGIATEYEYMSFSQDGVTNIYSQTKFTNSTNSSNSSSGSIVFSGGLSINCSTNAINVTNGGALTIAGGASIAGDLIVGGTITYSNAAASSSTFAKLILTSTDLAINASSGALITYGGIAINSTVNASNSTLGNALTVAGGASINKDLYVGTIGYIPTIISTNNTTTNAVFTQASMSNVYISNGLRSTFNSNTIGNVIFTTGGNVGINTSSPSVSLSVSGSVSIDSSLLINNPSGYGNIQLSGLSGGYLDLKSPSGTQYDARLINDNYGCNVVLNSSSSLVIKTDTGTNRLTVNSSGTLDITSITNINNTIVSSNSTTGGLVLQCGISIAKTSNSTSTTNGGALTIAGGASVLKDIYVGGTVTSSSDIRLKKNIVELNSTFILDKISKIRNVKYNTLDKDNTKTYIGCLAQDFEENFPELLYRDTDDSYYSLAYDRITSINMAGIKELYNKIKELSATVEKLQCLVRA